MIGGSDADCTQLAYARLTGFMFIFVIVVFAGGYALVAGLRVDDNFAETARNIGDSQLLYRAGLSLQFIASLGTVALAGGLYVLLRSVDANLALMAFGARLGEAVLGGVGLRFGFTWMQVHLVDGAGAGWDDSQLSSLAAVFSASQSAGVHASLIFFATGSLLFFVLFLRSTYIPRLLAQAGIAASALVALASLAFLLLPQAPKLLQLAFVPMFIVEIALGAWLLSGRASQRRLLAHSGRIAAGPDSAAQADHLGPS